MNSIRGYDSMGKESLPVHARAYRAFPPFSTLRARTYREKVCVFACSAYTCFLKLAAAEESMLTDLRADSRMDGNSIPLTITR